jgi:ankyrin repeat protein
VPYFPLAHAAEEGQDDTVKFLVKQGADVNKRGGVLGSALQAAAYFQGDYRFGLEIVDFLLKNDADVNARGGQFGNALQAAVARGNGKVVRLLQDNGALLDPSGADWDALLASIKEAIVEDDSGAFDILDEEDADKFTTRLDRFQRKQGIKGKTEA